MDYELFGVMHDGIDGMKINGSTVGGIKDGG